MSAPKVMVAGAGIGGLTAAIALRAKGIAAEVHEAAPQPRNTGTALGVASNAVKVLRSLGIDLAAGDRGAPIQRFELRTARGALIRALPIGAITAELGDPIVSIHRNELMRTLLDAVGDTPIHFGSELVDFDAGAAGVSAGLADGRCVHADVLIGADGLRSTVRSKIDGEAAPTEYGYICWLATVPFTHPRMVPGYAGHYWGKGQRFGLIDIGAGMAYWWATKNMPAARARDWNGGKDEIVAAFAGWAPEVVDVITRTPQHAIVSVPAQDRPFLERWGSGPVTLLGDAAHPMLTSMGQGASSAVEDSYVLAQALARVPDPVAALRKYEDIRRDRARMLVRNSRRLSRLEQARNPVVRAVRNLGLRCAPTRVLTRQNVRPMRFDLAW